MYYRYRWLWVITMSLIVMGAGYFFDLQKKIIHIDELQQTKKEWVEKGMVKPSSRVIHPHDLPLRMTEKNEVIDISNWVQLAHVCGVDIHSVKSMQGKIIHFVVQGTIDQLYAFISMLEKQNRIQMRQLSCKILNEDQLLIETDILLPVRTISFLSFATPFPELSLRHNPFCTTRIIKKVPHDLSSQLQDIPLRSLTMVGYLRQGQHVQALLLLPNHTLIAISPGVMLGKERGVASAIQSDGVDVQWQHRHRFKIKSLR